MGHIYTIPELLAFLLRRFWPILLVTVIGTFLAAVYAKSRPDTFEAVAVIQIEAPSVGQTSDGMAGLPAKPMAEVLQTVERNLTSRANMIEVLQRHRLFADLPGLSDDQKVAILRHSVSFQTVAAAGAQGYGGAPDVSAMIISVRLGDPEQAARLANDFAQGLLDRGNAGQAERTRDTLAFYQGEAERVDAEIAALEAETAAYSSLHADAMPATRELRRQEQIGLDTELRSLDIELAGWASQKAALESGGASRVTDQRQIQDLEARSAVAQAQRDSIIARRAAIDRSLADVPEIDRALAGYARRATQLNSQSEVIARRVAEAEAASRLNDRQQTERISLLERAIVPQYAMSGGGKKIVIAGAMASLAAAVGLAFLWELLRPVVRTAQQMERELGLTPVVSIPEITTSQRRNRRARDQVARLLDDPRKYLADAPRMAVVAGGAVLFLAVAAVIA